LDKVKITNHQVFALTAGFTCGSAILVISASAVSLAKRDSWISMLLTLVFGLIEICLICFFWSRYPGITYIEIIKQIFGKWIGSIIATCFVLFCLLSDSKILWDIGNFMTIQVIPETPAYIINIVFFTVVIIALFYGLEAIARSYEIFIYFISFLFISSMILVLPNARIDNLLPVFEKGVTPILKGSILLSSFLIFPINILLMIFPANADNTIKAKISFAKGYLWGGFLVFISIIVSILVLGSTITANSKFPVYLLAKEINLGIILTRFEFIVAAVWIVSILTRGILYLYAGVIGLAKLLKLKDHKKVILPLGLIIVIMSEVLYTDVIHQTSWDTYVWPLFAATFGLALPMVMVVGSYLRKRNKL